MLVRSSAVVVVALALLVDVTASDAITVRCQRMVAKVGSQLAQIRMKALMACEGRVVAAGTGACPDATASVAIDKGLAKVSLAIDRYCGGNDQVCGGDLTGEDLPGSLGWPLRCPDFERGGIDGPIDQATCGGIPGCLASHVAAAVDQAMDLYYGDLALPSTGRLNLCQATIGKAATAFLVAKSKALQKCWDAKLNGKLAPAASCTPPAFGDGKYTFAIAKAEAKMRALICKACGGADYICSGDDLTPAEIGFATTCPAVTIPGGASCAGPISDLASLVDCVHCVTEFKADCLDRLQVPQFADYPSECNACVLPEPSGACPTSLHVAFDGENADVDMGFTGLAHDSPYPSGIALTFGISGCAGATQPTCGQCTVGGSSGVPQRCQDQPWVVCSSTLDCTDAGAAGPCTSYFGPPRPSVFGGIPACSMNEIVGAASGSVDVDDGTTAIDLTLRSKTHIEGTPFHPCPVCSEGLCVGGPRHGAACAPQGGGVFGDVSLDCPPNPEALAGTQTTPLHFTSGTQSWTLSAASPACRETGYTSFRCFCDTCNNANAEACASNADCPLSGGNPGICGGRRCIGGGNAGAPCTSVTECPGGGQCGRPGEPTRPSNCFDDTATTGLDCVNVGDDEGACTAGPFESTCSIQTAVPCVGDADCNPPPAGVCDDCVPNQACVPHARSCFPDNGLIGNTVDVTGSSAIPCGGTSPTTLGALFCVPPTGTTLLNAGTGAPGLGRLRIPAEVQLVP